MTVVRFSSLLDGWLIRVGEVQELSALRPERGMRYCVLVFRVLIALPLPAWIPDRVRNDGVGVAALAERW